MLTYQEKILKNERRYTMQKILVALDGSDSCRKASNEAEKLAILCNSAITFITILTPKSKMSYVRNQALNEIKQREEEKEVANKMLSECDTIYNKCESNLKNSNIDVNRVVKEGDDPAKVICEYAENYDFDLIILADKGRSKVKKFLLGSTTEKVVRYSKTSVLVAK